MTSSKAQKVNHTLLKPLCVVNQEVVGDMVGEETPDHQEAEVQVKAVDSVTKCGFEEILLVQIQFLLGHQEAEELQKEMLVGTIFRFRLPMMISHPHRKDPVQKVLMKIQDLLEVEKWIEVPVCPSVATKL